MSIPKEIIREFEINVKGVVEGLFSGKHRSNVVGSSPEFAGHRPYVVGDDLRRIDWKVYARKQKLYLKTFLNESEVPILILFDNTRSMDMWGKHKRASIIAGMVMFAANRLNYRFSLLTLSGKYIPFNKGAQHLIRCFYETYNGGKRGDLLKSVFMTVSEVKKRVMVVVISDFEFEENDLQKGLNILLKFYDVVAFHVLSGEEWDFKYDGKVLVDVESGKRVSISPNSAGYYRERIRKWTRSIKDLVLQGGGRYSLIFSDTPMELEAKKVIETMGVV